MKKITVVAVFIFLFVFVQSSNVDIEIQVADQVVGSGFTMPFSNRGQDVPPPFGEAARAARAATASGATAAERGFSIDGQKAAVLASQVNPSGNKCLSPRSVFTAYGIYVGWDAAANSDVVLTGDQSQFLHVHFIDVGQGDATFVDFGDFEALIDGGGKQYGQAVVNYIKPYVDGNLDLVIASHMHGDHIGGLPAVLGAFSVSRLIDSGDTADTEIYREYQAAASGEEGCIYTGDENMVIAVGGELSLRIIDIADGQSNANNNSVVTQIDYHNVSILLTGDIQSAAEQMGLKYFRQADVLKAAHHGSKTSSTSDFLNVVQPRTVIISAGINNPNNHPHWRVLQRFAKIGAKVYGTFRSGTIVLTTNGLGYCLDTDVLLTEMDAGARAQPAG